MCLRMARIRVSHIFLDGVRAVAFPVLLPAPFLRPDFLLRWVMRALPLLMPFSGAVVIAPSCMSFRISCLVITPSTSSACSGFILTRPFPTLSTLAANCFWFLRFNFTHTSWIHYIEPQRSSLLKDTNAFSLTDYMADSDDLVLSDFREVFRIEDQYFIMT